jgi:hypothetical protein
MTSSALQGAGGALFTVETNGTVVVDYDDTTFVSNGALEYTYNGSVTYKTTLPVDPVGSTGSFTATPTGGSVTATYKDPVTGQYVSEPVGTAANVTNWTCNGDAMTLDVAADGFFTFDYTLDHITH